MWRCEVAALLSMHQVVAQPASAHSVLLGMRFSLCVSAPDIYQFCASIIYTLFMVSAVLCMIAISFPSCRCVQVQISLMVEITPLISPFIGHSLIQLHAGSRSTRRAFLCWEATRPRGACVAVCV